MNKYDVIIKQYTVYTPGPLISEVFLEIDGMKVMISEYKGIRPYYQFHSVDFKKNSIYHNARVIKKLFSDLRRIKAINGYRTYITSFVELSENFAIHKLTISPQAGSLKSMVFCEGGTHWLNDVL